MKVIQLSIDIVLSILIILSLVGCQSTNNDTSIPTSKVNAKETYLTSSVPITQSSPSLDSNSSTLNTTSIPTTTTQWTTSTNLQKKAIVIDHTCTNIKKIPEAFIVKAKAELKVVYFHTSHGAQITVGMSNLQDLYPSLFNFNETGDNNAISYQEVNADLGTDGSLAWVEKTRTYLNNHQNDCNVVIWSWCGGVSGNTEDGINRYLNAMDQLENEYPQVTFIYMTGHLDGSGEDGNLNIRNNQIRDYVSANNKILYDFADIESYNPDGQYFLNLGANADCSYDNGNWAQEWVAQNPDSDLGGNLSDIYHTHILNCNMKGRAFWALMACIVGWQVS